MKFPPKLAEHDRDDELLKLFTLALITFNERMKVEMKHFSISIYKVQVFRGLCRYGLSTKEYNKITTFERIIFHSSY